MTKISFSILSVFFLIGCQSVSKKDLKPEHLIVSDIKVPPEEITQVQAREDIQYLIYALTKGYGGRNHLPHGFLDSAFQKIRSINFFKNNEDFKNQIDEAFLIIPDHHLKARLKGKPSEARASLWRTGRVGKNTISDSKKTWEVRLDKHGRKRVLYISISSFPPHKDDKWSGFLPEVKNKITQADLAVLDFRGNGGGDDTMGWQLAEIFYGRSFDSPLTKQYTSQMPETFLIYSNNFRIRKLIGEREGRSVPNYINDSISETMAKYQEAIDGKLAPERVTIETSKYSSEPINGFKKPIYILMDGECASSCESSIDYFETHTYVKRVGENTAGYIHFGNIGYVILPHSRIEVQIPTHYNEYFDGRFLEKVGIKPDILVPAGTDAYEYVKKNLIK